MKELIESCDLIIDEIDSKSFYNSNVSKKYEKEKIKLFKKIINDYCDSEEGISELVDGLYDSTKSNFEYFKIFLEGKTKNLIVNNFGGEELYKLALKNRSDELELILKHLKNLKKANSKITVNTKTRELLSDEDYEYDENFKIKYLVKVSTLSVYDAVMNNPQISNETKEILKKYYKK